MKRKLSNPECDSFGHKYWYNEAGRFHRDNDLPAIERTDGSKYWYKNNKIHRDNNLPAIEHANGDKAWYLNNVCYRWDEWIDKL